MQKYLLLIFTSLFLASCFDSGGGDESGGGGLFNNHTKADNLFVLIPPVDKTYVENNNIDLVLKHSFNITVTGTPQVEINIGGSSVNATYLTGSGSKNITFRYTVQAGDNDSDGVEITPSINLNGGSMTFSESGVVTDANLDFGALPTDDVLVDTTGPTLALVTPPDAKTYYYNQQMTFIAAFDDTVFVNGTPRFAINIGGTTRYAEYFSGNGGLALIFNYVVDGSDVDADGIEMLSPIELNGGSIKDANGNNATLTFTPIPMPTTFVDGDTPYISRITPPVNNTYLASQQLDMSVEFTEVVNVTGAPRIEAAIGTNNRFLSYISGSGSNTLNFRYTAQPGDDDLDGISLGSVIDLNGGTIRDASLNDAFIDLQPPLLPNVKVDAGLPRVLTIGKPLDNTYRLNDEMFFTLQFDREVSITGIPRVQLDLTSGTAFAEYISGTGTDTIVFRHQVQNGEIDLDGIEINNTLNLNGGDILAANGMSANLDLTTATALIDLTAVFIDASPATIIALTPPADNNYVTGNDLDFTATFSKPVNVTGTPRIQLELGSNTVFANYVSGTGTSNVLFRYNIQPADNDNDGIEISNASIDLNTSGTIRDTSAIDANLDMTSVLPDLSNVKVNVATVNITSITPPPLMTPTLRLKI